MKDGDGAAPQLTETPVLSRVASGGVHTLTDWGSGDRFAGVCIEHNHQLSATAAGKQLAGLRIESQSGRRLAGRQRVMRCCQLAQEITIFRDNCRCRNR